MPRRRPIGPSIWTGSASPVPRSARSSRVTARGAPAGLGAPVYGKLDTDLGAAMLSINAVKGVEIGEGMAAATLRGEDNADEITMGPDGPVYSSNHAGGILGGISTGQDIVVRFAVKPTSSILTAAQDDHQGRRRNRDHHQGPPRPLRRHPCGARGRGDDGLRASRPPASGPRPDRRAARPDRLNTALIAILAKYREDRDRAPIRQHCRGKRCSRAVLLGLGRNAPIGIRPWSRPSVPYRATP